MPVRTAPAPETLLALGQNMDGFVLAEEFSGCGREEIVKWFWPEPRVY